MSNTKTKPTLKNTKENHSKAVSIAMQHFTINPQNTRIEKDTNPKIKLSEGFKSKWVQKIRSEDRNTQAYEQYCYYRGDMPIAIAQALRIVGVEHSIINDMSGTQTIQQYRFLPKEFTNDISGVYSPLVQKIMDFELKNMSPKWIASYIEKHM